MSAIDLMGGYAAYTTLDAAVAELATTGASPVDAQSTITIVTTTLLLITTITAGD